MGVQVGVAATAAGTWSMPSVPSSEDDADDSDQSEATTK
jgi:hypothetical protein